MWWNTFIHLISRKQTTNWMEPKVTQQHRRVSTKSEIVRQTICCDYLVLKQQLPILTLTMWSSLSLKHLGRFSEKPWEDLAAQVAHICDGTQCQGETDAALGVRYSLRQLGTISVEDFLRACKPELTPRGNQALTMWLTANSEHLTFTILCGWVLLTLPPFYLHFTSSVSASSRARRLYFLVKYSTAYIWIIRKFGTDVHRPLQDEIH